MSFQRRQLEERRTDICCDGDFDQPYLGVVVQGGVDLGELRKSLGKSVESKVDVGTNGLLTARSVGFATSMVAKKWWRE